MDVYKKIENFVIEFVIRTFERNITCVKDIIFNIYIIDRFSIFASPILYIIPGLFAD